MVYCSKCGTLNSDTANNCIKCGALLQAGPAQEADPYWRYRNYEGSYRQRKVGAGLGALVFGIIIILVDLGFLLSELYSISIPWWPIILILVGLWVLFIGFRRNWRNHPQSSPQPQ